MTLSYAFGGNTGQSYDALQRRRAYLEAVQKAGQGAQPKTGAEGILSGLNSVFSDLMLRKLGKQEDANREAANQKALDLFGQPSQYGGGGASVPAYVPPDPNSPSQLGHDTMVALGKAPATPTKDEMSAYIAAKATELGIDPSVAVAVANSEGLNANPADGWQSGVVKNGQREPSYGPFQLYMGGGLGNNFLKQTGLDPRDPTTWKKQVDFALGHAKTNGWGSWYGARNSGIGDFQGIGGQPQGASGIDPNIVQAIGDPNVSPEIKSALSILLQQKIAAAQPPDPMKALELQKAQLEVDNLRNPQATTAEYGLQPIVTQDADGKYHLFQLPKDGGPPKEVQLPYGWTPKQQYLDTGTGFQAVPTQGVAGNSPVVVPKDVSGKAAATAVGEAAGAAQVALPGAAQAAQDVATQVESLKNDPYLPRMLGPVDSMLPNVSTDAARVQGKMDQLQGGAFLQARQLLKGGGAITDYEGQKAEAAFARMSKAQSVEDYKAALDEFNYYVQQGVKKLQDQAAMTTPTQAMPTGAATTYRFNPATGKIEPVQ